MNFSYKFFFNSFVYTYLVCVNRYQNVLFFLPSPQCFIHMKGSHSGWSPFFKVITIFMYLCFLICASRTSGFSSPKNVRLILNLWKSLSAWFSCTYISINQYMYSILCSIWLLVQNFFQILDHINTKGLLFCTYHTYS